ncbi:uncharacterized protein LOC124928237 [Impatiens glandulifera]|uniref:uncharacterized protein LOC124928237 n=1 Tax=Impatiens glandulifera TaxID=253017 RepID=UPI001FB1547E|nr:uncharacterized protein LOC124928237 [Impatiens glandulifera]
MGKKRKSVATSLDEVDRTMYSSFCSAANSLSQLYTQAMHQQKLTFQAGERHGLEKLYQLILRQQEGGSRVNSRDILCYLQTELDYHGEEPSMSPRGGPGQNQNSQQPSINITNPSFLVSSGSSVPTNHGHGFRSDHNSNDQHPKNCVFSNALSSPVRRSLQNYHTTNNNPNGFQSENRDSNPSNSNDSSMDMHAED